MYRLTEQRIDRAALVRTAYERYVAEHVVSEPSRVKASLANVLGRALAEPARRAAWLASFVKASDALGDAVATLWERRAEIASRMGLAGPDEIEAPAPDLAEVASRWLDRTADLFAEVAPGSLAALMDLSCAGAASTAFPRHLLPRTVLDPFRETDLFRSVALDPGDLPEPYNAASFVRALLRVGAAWVDATAPGDQPFVVAHDPYGLRRRTIGALFGILPSTAAFARRAFDVDASRMQSHVRALGLSLLVESRALALRVLLRRPALAGRAAFREAFEDGTARAFGLPLAPRAAGVLFRLHADDGQRFAGLLLAGSESAALREAYDDDWYRNPRAIERLRDESRLSPDPTTTKDALHAASDALYAALVERIT
jgi:hypothetical protein